MIYEVNEEELFYLISEKNEDAEMIFYGRIENYLQFLSRTYSSVFLRQDDILSYGWQGVIEAFDCYNPQAGVSFASFVRNCIQRRIIDIRRRNNQDKRKAIMTKIEHDNYEQLIGDKHTTEIRTVQHLLTEVLAELEQVLKPREWRTFQCYLQQSSAQATADALGISLQTVYRTVARTKTAVKCYLEDN
ncbi:sigma-70 family RNA polymerase sigma factor [Culicoidibacter larvae]|uniref:Sigma-70 family RNA polymerase sigma factor n=1 Tax=Culicoidibacter larvae TaxID=2579976 RepID=A0A5R8QHW4_9FIRM|nr:sigma-70 family RNA polymerase sigma factor [Culicoidibacter larvae]TLG77280.1 sigma-70 family RNA polymerase sigma factor [Culicoidibacter larvae]